MKKLIYNPLILSLFIVALSFTSCQEEFEEIGGDEQETLAADSNTAKLIENTSTNDGSFDNIVDGASCFAVNFPYTVDVGGVQITIDSKEDLHLIEEIFDEFDDDEDVLDFLFPITITLGDFTEIVIENKERLIELAAECREGGDDDDIECIDFVYPITLFTFDVNEQQTGTVEVNSDKELRRFFAGLGENDLISIDYPITLKKFDGSEIVVDSNAELAAALEAAKNECDEDDDNDFNDDDFDEERFVEYLTECPWELRDIRRNGMDQTDQYREFVFEFGEDGVVEVTAVGGSTAQGEWEVEFTDHGPQLTMEFGTYVDFSFTWFVYEIEEGKIKFYSDNDNRIILKRLCDGNGDDGNSNPDTLREILKECEWIIKKVKNQGEEIDRLLGYEFKFMAEGVVTLSDGITTSEGTWEVGLNDDNIPALLISIGAEGAVSFDWPLRDLNNARLKFEVEEVDYELVLQRVCDDNAGDEDVAEIRNIMLGGLWDVASLMDEGMDETADYAGMDFGFSMFHQVEVSINDDPIKAGLWRVIRNKDNQLKFYLNLGGDDTFGDLTEAWYVGEVTADRIELIYEDENITSKTLVFEKKV